MVDMKHGKVYTPACMPASGVDFTGETAWVYGWGKTDMFSDYNADTLRFFTPQRVTHFGSDMAEQSACGDHNHLKLIAV